MEVNEVLATISSRADLELVLKDNIEQMRKPHLLVSRYNHEKATNKDYNGRQLLELIQNADDAGSSYVAIELDQPSRLLRIINVGAPFTMEGFRSLMVPNLSSKVKKHYIGNKGLGFRSVLNWSEEVTVYSADLRVRFSRKLAADYFNDWYEPDQQTSIREEFRLAAKVVPFPLFAVPEIESQSLYPESTVIEIRFLEEALEDICAQLKALQPEVLLFLNHIREIRLSGTDNDRTDKVDWKGDMATIGERAWVVKENKTAGQDPQLPESYKDADTIEDEFYSLKIALQKGLHDRVNLLFSFFPTKVTLNFPAVVHGTFELDSSRNRIIESPKNKFLAGELLELLFKAAMQLDGWDRFRLLNYQAQSDTYLKSIGFYQRIDDFIRTQAVFPCADGSCRTYGNLRILPENITKLITDLGRQADFPELLNNIPDDLGIRFNTLFPYHNNEKGYIPAALISRIEKASAALHDNIPVREYASWLAAIKPLFPSTAQRMLKVLYNDQQLLADTSVTLFSPSFGSRIKIPDYVNIEYLHPTLYQELVRALHPNDPSSRRLKQELANFVGLESFEPVPVLREIIAATKTEINKQIPLDEQRRLVRVMMASLFEYYNRSDKAKNTELRILDIPVINASGNIASARETFLSVYYNGGRKRQNLLPDIYGPNELIADPTELGIADNSDTERFLVDFLGVQRFVALATYNDSPKFERGYQEFVFNATGNRPQNLRDARISGTYIRNYDILKQAMQRGRLSPEQFIAWICVDDEIREIAGRNGETRFEYANSGQAHGNYPHSIQLPPAYIRYQLVQLGGFSDYVLETDYIDYLNRIRFNASAACLQSEGISTDRIREAQRLAGAKNTFAELPLSRIAEILRSMPTEDPNGKHARKIYQLCANRFRDKKDILTDKNGLELHGNQDGKKRYAPWAEVYYNRKISLPARITAGKTLLNFPKRGAENNITGFFKVMTFDDINYVPHDYTPDDEATRALSLHLRRIRPFILVERLSRLESGSEKKEAVRLVKSLNIILCKRLNYTLDGQLKEAEPYDFIESAEDKHTWLIHYTGNSTIQSLVTDYQLSDAVSEIWSIVFDLANIAAEISFIFRDELNYTKRRLTLIHGDDELAEAESFLEVSEHEKDFWRKIGRLLGTEKTLFDDAEQGDYRQIVATELHIDRMLMTGIDYHHLTYPDNLLRFQLLFGKLGITLAQFNREFQLDLSFYQLHKDRWEQLAAAEKPLLNAAYWLECAAGGRVAQENFIIGAASLEKELASPLAQLNKEVLVPEYLSLLERAIEIRFPNGTGTSDYQATYQSNLRALPAVNFEINSWSPEDRSLLYFKLSEDDLTRFREKLRVQRPERSPTDPTPEEGDPVPEVSEMEKAGPNADRTPPGTDPTRNGNSGYGGGGFGSGTDADRRALGLRAEKMVLKSLAGKTYQWMSGYSNDPSKDDRAGYDIRYKEPEDQQWYYIEVKWFERGMFRLPDTEFNFAKRNPGRYFIYLVTTDQIRKVLFRDLVDEDGEFVRDNDYFAYAVSEYKFRQLS